MPMVAYRDQVNDVNGTYLVLDVEGVGRKSENDGGLADGLVAEEDDLILHLRRWVTRSFCHFIV